MFNRNPCRHRPFTFACLVVVCALTLIAALTMARDIRPTTASMAFDSPAAPIPEVAFDGTTQATEVRVGNGIPAPGTVNVPIELVSRGTENAIGFSLSFDPRQWRFVSATADADTSEASIIVNDDEAASGRLGVVVALPAGHRLMAGARRIVIINFDPLFDNRDNHRPGAGSIEFSDYPVMREVADVQANALPAIFVFGRQSSKGRRP